MSTIFGVTVPHEKEPVEVAYRDSTIQFTNSLAPLLPDNTPVIAIDNDAQGIHTIGDIKKKINNSSSRNKY